MKIALVAPSYIPATRANTIQTMKMADAFAGLGDTVRVLVPGEHSGKSPDEIKHHYGLSQTIETVYLPAWDLLRRYDFGFRTVSHGYSWGAQLLFTRLPQAAAFASWQGLPVIYEAHDLPRGLMGTSLFKTFLRGPHARGLVVISQSLANDLKARFALPDFEDFIQVLPDGVDLERYANLPTPAQARAALSLREGFTVGYSGHFYPGRGVELILEMAAHVPDICFRLMGGTLEDVARLQPLAPPNISFTGFVPNADLPRYQAACDVLLMPYQSRVSASSGGDIAAYLSPMKLFEYLACARPILASDLPVLREVLVPDGNALTLPAADVPAWVAALRRLQADPQLCQRLGAAARDTAQRYSWRERAARILDRFTQNE
jgi:glycosyltransferase involved in cell wall biosynthesis